jgi:hypothetical protein
VTATNLSARDNVVERVDGLVLAAHDRVLSLEPAVPHMSARRKIDRKDALSVINRLRDELQAAIAALSAGSPEPTREMIEAGERAWMSRNLNDPDSNPIRDCYLAMEAARKGGE